MKKIMTLVVFTLFAGIGASAQTVYDAAKITNKDLNGTARFVGMGGAMGALGGDITTMGVNPAGIGIYRSNEVVATLGYSMNGTESQFAGKSISSNSDRFNFNNIGIVYSSKVGDATALRYVNFGFNYKRSKSFYKNMSMEGALNAGPKGKILSQVNQMAAQATSIGVPPSDLMNKGAFNYDDVGWLSVLGQQGNLFNNVLNTKDNAYDYYSANDSYIPYANFYSKETGGIDQYDFNMSFNFNDRFYLGATIGAYDVDYSKYSSYSEGFGNEGEGYNLQSWNNISGSGFDFKLGFILRPIESSSLRLGFAVHTPTFYDLTLATSARLESKMFVNDKLIQTDVDTYDHVGGDARREFRLQTPWKFNGSVGYTIGKNLALGAEYEYEDYSAARFYYSDGAAMDEVENPSVKRSVKGVSTFRIGAEYKITPEFAWRLGYNYSSAAFKNDAWKELPNNSINTDTDYANTKGMSNYTMGFGYRGRIFYTDLAYKYTSYKEDFYAFEELYLNKTNVTNSNHQVLLTLGVRF